MSDFKETFYNTLKTRNPKQQEAIEAIEGPVMVIAGPGTGKTDVLGLRIGNILEKTQIGIHNILCLTYTEAGAVEMRKRLIQYIGPTAYNAQIFTFHGFCNMVIHENPDRFDIFRDAQPVSDLEQFQILKEIIDALPLDNPLKRHTGNLYYETRRLHGLFDAMKLEHWTTEFMHKTIDAYVHEQEENGNYVYKTSRVGKYQKGDLKLAQLKKDVYLPMELLRAGVDTFSTYNTSLKNHGRYDYHDMLTWVFEVFGKDEDLLRQYQERYQYFLVDEFQDSNGIQLDILRQLASFWPRPDLFIVGDDDQSIFRFQGANMHNITTFKNEFEPQVVVLTDNYRSSQNILDAASHLIENNEERLVKQYPEYAKNLVARGPDSAYEVLPEIKVYPNETQEQAALLAELTDLYRNGILEHETVAVIYRKHRQVENLLHAMEVRDLPIVVKRPVNILYRPIVQNVLTMMQYVADEVKRTHSAEHLLFEILHYNFFDIPSQDAGRIAMFCRREKGGNKQRWREVTSDEKLLRHIKVESIEQVLELDSQLAQWISNYEHVTIQELLEQILTRAGVLQYVFNHPNRTWHFQLVKTLFDHVKRESKRNPDLTLSAFLDDIRMMRDHGIELPVHKTMSAKDGIHFVTAHSSKGMEFDRVYMFGCTKNIWDNQRAGYGDRFKLPDLYTKGDEVSDEDERRLFYVGMTRARRYLTMSYAELNDQERELESSRFIQEILNGGSISVERNVLPEEHFAEYCMDLMKPVETHTPIIDHALIDRALENFQMSVSVLNKFLECPRKFYFENILRVPSAQKTYFGFGNAIHGALHDFFTWKVEKQTLTGEVEDLVNFYEHQMKFNKSYFTQKEYEGHLHEGKQILRSYFAHRSESWRQPQHSLTEHRVVDVHHRGIPIKGNLDRIDVYKDQVVVTDYKTGKASNAAKGGKLNKPSEKYPMGGNYWRQIVFYKMLLDANPELRKPMTAGYIDFVQPSSKGEHLLRKFTVTPEDIEHVSAQLADSFEKIKAHAFHDGCEQCYWCDLVRNNMNIDKNVALPEEVE